MYSIKISLLSSGILKLNDVEEFVSGFNYFFIRHSNEETISFSRKDIVKIERRLKNGKYKIIKLKKPKLLRKVYVYEQTSKKASIKFKFDKNFSNDSS